MKRFIESWLRRRMILDPLEPSRAIGTQPTYLISEVDKLRMERMAIEQKLRSLTVSVDLERKRVSEGKQEHSWT